MNKNHLLAARLFFCTHSNAVYALDDCVRKTLMISGWDEVPASWTNCFGKIEFNSKAEKIAGNKYVGEFNKGKMHGQGTYTRANGRKIRGMVKVLKRGVPINTLANGRRVKGTVREL